MFAGHTDVVPPGPLESWRSPPFSPSIRYDKLYGRGACDMKGAIAAFIVAVENFINKQKEFKGSLIIALTSDEEGNADFGTKEIIKKIQQNSWPIKYCLIGEPTSTQTLGDGIKIGRRGSLNGFATIKSKQGHVAYAKQNTNVIHKITPVMEKLQQIKFPHANPHFPNTSFHITYINSGDGTTNVVPENLDLQFNFRYPDNVSSTSIMKKVNQCFNSLDCHYEIKWHHSAKPYYHKPDLLTQTLTEIIKEQLNITPELNTKGGTSDGRFLTDLGCQIAEFGLNNKTIHQVNENVKVQDIIDLSKIYEQTLLKLL